MEELEGAGRTRVVVDKRARVLGYSGNHCYFCHFVNASLEPLEMSFDAVPNKD
jgi:hypothetical protein